MTAMMEAVEAIRQFAKVTVYDKRILTGKQRDNIWYGRNIIDIDLGGYTYSLQCKGNTRGMILFNENGRIRTEEWTDMNEDGLAGEMLEQHGFCSDSNIVVEGLVPQMTRSQAIFIYGLSDHPYDAHIWLYEDGRFEFAVYKEGTLIGSDGIYLEDFEKIRTEEDLTKWRNNFFGKGGKEKC